MQIGPNTNVNEVRQGWIQPYRQTVAVRNVLETVIALVVELAKDLFGVRTGRAQRESLSYAQIISYTRGFNHNATQTQVLVADNYQIEALGLRGWSAFDKNDLDRSMAYRVLRNVIDSNDRLSVSAGKKYLVIPVNVHQSHWTSIHINLENRTVYYLDPLGSTVAKVNNINYHQLVQSYLQGIKECMEFLSPGHTYNVLRGRNSPSVIQKTQQYDSWNCGVFMFHYAMKAAELSQRNFRLDFCETLAGVWSRRAHIIQVFG
jgi:hypothetical protein